MKRIISFVVCMAVIFSSGLTFASAAEIPETIAETAVMIDSQTGTVLVDKAMNKEMYPASTTKVLTALIALQNLEKDRIITIDAETAATTGSKMSLKEGEELTVDQLLHGLLIMSANDAAVALAKAVSGSIENFSVLMNQKATELGTLNSYFVTPHGLPNESHVTSAFDLALIAKEAMKNREFRDIVGTIDYTIPATNMSDTRVLKNTNRLLWDDKHTFEINEVKYTYFYEGATGIKTGYTEAAQSCLVASAKKGDTELITVILKSSPTEMWADAIKLFDYGFSNYHTVIKASASEVVGEAKVLRGASKTVELVPVTNIAATLPMTQSMDSLSLDIKTNKIKAPFEKGTVAGTATLKQGDQVLGQYELVTAEGIETNAIGRLISAFSGNWKLFTAITIILLLILFTTAAYLQALQRAKKKAKEKRKQQERRKRQNSRRWPAYAEDYRRYPESPRGTTGRPYSGYTEDFRSNSRKEDGSFYPDADLKKTREFDQGRRKTRSYESTSHKYKSNASDRNALGKRRGEHGSDNTFNPGTRTFKTYNEFHGRKRNIDK